MSIQSREDAVRLAQQIVKSADESAALIQKLQDQDMSGLECPETRQLEKLSAEITAVALLFAQWFLNPPTPSPLVKPQICLVLVRPDNFPVNSPNKCPRCFSAPCRQMFQCREPASPANIEVGGNRVTPTMLEAAEDLLHTILTGERQLPRDLYEVVARAFGTTRDDAKGRILLALYGGKSAPMALPSEKPST